MMASWSMKWILYGGLHASITDLGGVRCAHHIPFWIKVTESLGVLVASPIVIVWTRRTLSYVSDEDVMAMRERVWRVGSGCRSLMLMILALVFGMELSFKLVTGRLIFVLNPCHLIAITQLYLLCVVPSKLSVAIFRIMIHNLFGAFLGLLFAATTARQLPGQVSVYWMQHALICIIPMYIIYSWGPRCLELLSDWSWARTGLLVFGLYHHCILLPLAELTYVNLGFMLCPPSSDPIGGPYYRFVYTISMSIMALTIGKLYCATYLWIANKFSVKTKEK